MKYSPPTEDTWFERSSHLCYLEINWKLFFSFVFLFYFSQLSCILVVSAIMKMCNYDSLSKHSMVAGYTYISWCVFTLATFNFTVPSLFLSTSKILAKGQVEREILLSETRTSCPNWKFLLLTFHFFLSVNKGTHSFNYLRQNMSVAP